MKLHRTFRHRLGLAILLFVGLAAYSGYHTTTFSAAVAPASSGAIMQQAVQTSQGVQIDWTKADSSQSVEGFAIERSRCTARFTTVAQVEKGADRYLDVDGHVGDEYRVAALNDAHIRYAPSNTIMATEQKPGKIDAAVHEAPHILSDKATDSATQSADLQSLVSDSLTKLNTALSAKDYKQAAGLLYDIQLYNRDILALMSTLPHTEKAKLSVQSKQYAEMLKSNIFVLPENMQTDGYLVAAGFQAIQDSAQ